MELLEFFNFPSSFAMHQRLTKKSFYEQGGLSSAGQKLLQDQVGSIKIEAQITPDKANIPAYKTEMHEYLEVFVINVSLKSSQAWRDLTSKQIKTLHEMVHKAISYPVILMLQSGGRTQLSQAERLINKADASSEKLVLGDLFLTNWIETTKPQEIEQAFLGSLGYAQQHHQNLYALYQGWMQRVVALLLAEQTGIFEQSLLKGAIEAESLNQQRERLKIIIQLDKEINELKNKVATSLQFNEKVAFNVQLQNLNAQLEQAKGHKA